MNEANSIFNIDDFFHKLISNSFLIRSSTRSPLLFLPGRRTMEPPFTAIGSSLLAHQVSNAVEC